MLQRNIIIFEPYYSAHLLQYVQNLVKLFSDKKLNIIFATTQLTIESDEYKIHLKKYEPLFQIEILNHHKKYWSKADYSIAFLKLLFKYPKHQFFVPLLDHIFFLIGFLNFIFPLRKFAISGILLRGIFAYTELPFTLSMRLKGWASKLICRWGIYTKIFIIDDLVYNYLAHPKCRTIVLCPDPIDKVLPFPDTMAARKTLNLPNNALIIGVVGEINVRKGVDTLIRAFVKQNNIEGQLLLIAGKQSEEITQQLETLKKDNLAAYIKIIQINHYMPQTEYLACLQSIDIVALLYRQHIGPASTMVRAAIAGKKIVTTDFGWTGYMGKRAIRCYLVKDLKAFSLDALVTDYSSTHSSQSHETVYENTPAENISTQKGKRSPSNHWGEDSQAQTDINFLSDYYSLNKFNQVVWEHLATT